MLKPSLNHFLCRTLKMYKKKKVCGTPRHCEEALWVRMSLCVTSVWQPERIHLYTSTLVQTLAWKQEANGGSETVAHRQKDWQARRTTDESAGQWTCIYLSSLWLGSGWRGPGEPSLAVWTARSGQAEKQLKQQHKSLLHFWHKASERPRGAAAPTRAQLTRSSLRHGACIMFWVYIKSVRKTIKCNKVNFCKQHTCFYTAAVVQFCVSLQKKKEKGLNLQLEVNILR